MINLNASNNVVVIIHAAINVLICASNARRSLNRVNFRYKLSFLARMFVNFNAISIRRAIISATLSASENCHVGIFVEENALKIATL